MVPKLRFLGKLLTYHPYSKSKTTTIKRLMNQIDNAKSKRAPLFLEGVDFGRWLGISIGLGLLSALTLMVAELRILKEQTLSLYDVVQNIFAYSACALLALIFGEKLGLESLLTLRRGSWPAKAWKLLCYGGLAGCVMGLAYHRAFLVYRFRPGVMFRTYHLRDWHDNFTLSLSAAVSEELVFRLLLLTAFLYLFQWLFRPMLGASSRIQSTIPGAFALISSSLLFGTVHGTFGFLFAFVAGMVLGIIFLRGGLESAILAHFVTDFAFFYWTYLK